MKTYNKISQSPVVAPVDACVRCSKVSSLSTLTSPSTLSMIKYKNKKQTFLDITAIFFCIQPVFQNFARSLELEVKKLKKWRKQCFRKIYVKMPLIIMCGYPCSGKTRRTEELKEYFEKQRGKTVRLVGDHTIGVDRNNTYSGIIIS